MGFDFYDLDAGRIGYLDDETPSGFIEMIHFKSNL